MGQEIKWSLEQMELQPVDWKSGWRELVFWHRSDNKGVGVVEVILILVVLIALVLIFKDQLTALVQKLLKNVSKDALKI